MNEYRQAMVEAARSGDSTAYYRAKAVAEFMEATSTADFPSYFFDREFGDIKSAPGMTLLHPFDPKKHPRGRRGKFIDVLKTLRSSPRFGVAGVTLPSGHRVTHRFGQFRVHDREGKIVARGLEPEDIRLQLDTRRTTPNVQTPRLRVFDETRVAAKADPGTLTFKDIKPHQTDFERRQADLPGDMPGDTSTSFTIKQVGDRFHVIDSHGTVRYDTPTEDLAWASRQSLEQQYALPVTPRGKADPGALAATVFGASGAALATGAMAAEVRSYLRRPKSTARPTPFVLDQRVTSPGGSGRVASLPSDGRMHVQLDSGKRQVFAAYQVKPEAKADPGAIIDIAEKVVTGLALGAGGYWGSRADPTVRNRKLKQKEADDMARRQAKKAAKAAKAAMREALSEGDNGRYLRARARAAHYERLAEVQDGT